MPPSWFWSLILSHHWCCCLSLPLWNKFKKYVFNVLIVSSSRKEALLGQCLFYLLLYSQSLEASMPHSTGWIDVCELNEGKFSVIIISFYFVCISITWMPVSGLFPEILIHWVRDGATDICLLMNLSVIPKQTDQTFRNNTGDMEPIKS